jgi:hypothetical protein
VSQFALGRKILVRGFAGYGAQFNHNAFAQVTRDLGVTERHLQELEQQVHRLAPRFVRIFFDPRALPGSVAGSDDLMRSFERTVALAQSAASTINITWTGGGQDHPDRNMKAFANVLARLVKKHDATKLRWVTVGNEPNRTRITLREYETLYRKLRLHLNEHGLRRDRVGLMGGDLVQNNQARWCNHLAQNMSDVLDAWSIHVYWRYDELGPGLKTKLVKRLRDVRGICNVLATHDLHPKPVYITEYGVRGIWRTKRDVVGRDGSLKKKLVKVKPEPGIYKPQGAELRGRRVVDLNLNAFQHAWFNLLAPTLGYQGLSKWDAYFAKYDLKNEPFPQEYGMIGRPKGQELPLRPLYHLTRLFTQTVKPGWNVREVVHAPGSQIVAAYSAPSGDGLTLIGLDTAGATLVGPVNQKRSYHFSKLPKNKSFNLVYWNRRGHGRLTSPGQRRTDGAGNLTIEAPLHSVFALTTVSVDP